MQQWYEQHFQEDYVKIYAHRNDESAAAELEKIDKLIGFEPGKKLFKSRLSQEKFNTIFP